MNVDKTWTIFLDRDGVINEPPKNYYVHNWAEFTFAEGAIKALKNLRSKVGRLIIITNQQGVGKRQMSHQALAEIHKKLSDALLDHDIIIDKIYACTDLRSKVNNARKPSPRMGYRAANEFDDIHFNKAVMVGDQKTDIQFGRNLGVKTVLIRNTSSDEPLDCHPDEMYSSLLEFSETIS